MGGNVTGIARHFTVSRPTIEKLIDDCAELAARPHRPVAARKVLCSL